MASQQYKFVKDYSSGFGAWTKGQTVELEEDQAAWMNRDVPDCLVPVKEEKKKDEVVEERTVDEPPATRQVTKPEQKRGA
jgi:hypothetical protein